MAAFSRGLRELSRSPNICSRCFSTSTSLLSGHNRWSKIRHEKGANDAKKSKLRSSVSAEISMASKLYGPDPVANPKLAMAIAAAKKAALPKASIEAAIARGQGISSTGRALENLTLEVMSASNIAMVINMETDNKLKTLQDVRVYIKHARGTITPTNYLFQKRGRVQFEKDEKGLTPDDVLEEAIEAGAEDVEADEDGNIVVWTEPTNTIQLAEALKSSLNLKVESSEIIWDPNEDTMAPISSKDDAQVMMDMFDKMADDPTVEAVYTNATQGVLSDEEWAEFQSRAAL